MTSDTVQQAPFSVWTLCALFAFRMLGLFMIFPVLSPYAGHLPGGTPALIGLALGIYGLTQALLQLPFGMLSDRFGRKPILLLGFGLFCAGSLVAASAHTMIGLILGRALQGMGAVGSTIMATVADVTTASQRTQAMAKLGLTIALSFSVAMIVGPFCAHWFGVDGLFYLTAALGGLGLCLVCSLPAGQRDAALIPQAMSSLLRNRDLLRLDFGIFALHAILTASFIVLPLRIQNHLGQGNLLSSMIYFPIILTAFALAIPLIIVAEKRRRLKSSFLKVILLLGLVAIGFCYSTAHFYGTLALLVLFFAFFTFLEAALPSMVSKLAPAASKGTAMGIYSSCQFAGMFVGGSVGGLVYHHGGSLAVFFFCAALAGLWWCVTLGLTAPQAEAAAPAPTRG